MNIKPFEDLKVTTITLIIGLVGQINRDAIFNLLPITILPKALIQATSKRGIKSSKLPYAGKPGLIISLGYKGKHRGMIRATRVFKNCVNLHIANDIKNISVKIASKTIHMCGVLSKDDGINTATLLLDKIKAMQVILDKISAMPDQAATILEWLIERTRGYTITRLINDRPILDYDLHLPLTIPKSFDLDIITFYLSLMPGICYHSDYVAKLKSIPRNLQLFSKDLTITSAHEVMVNYNYTIGFYINRANLAKLIYGRNGFLARYNNAIANHVTIEYPYVPDSNTSHQRKGNKKPHHSFLVYRSGSVTQSGPGGEVMRQMYYLFMNTIAEIAAEISA